MNLKNKVFLGALMLIMMGSITPSFIFASQMGVVVKFSEGDTFQKCVEFFSPTSAFGVMNQSGLELVWKEYGGLGHALCKIRDTGCPENNCFCSLSFWNFLYKKPDQSWAMSPVGADGYNAQDHEVIGWAWGSFGSSLPNISFEQICGGNLPPITPAIPPTVFSPPSPESPQAPEHSQSPGSSQSSEIAQPPKSAQSAETPQESSEFLISQKILELQQKIETVKKNVLQALQKRILKMESKISEIAKGIKFLRWQLKAKIR